MQQQKWEGLHLDKDIIIPGNKIYGPDTCAFVPIYINSFFNTPKIKNKTMPLGVSLVTRSSDMINELNNPYTARVRLYGKVIPLGCFNNTFDAHRAWQVGKLEATKTVMKGYLQEESFNRKVYEGFQLRVIKLENNHKEGIITEWL